MTKQFRNRKFVCTRFLGYEKLFILFWFFKKRLNHDFQNWQFCPHNFHSFSWIYKKFNNTNKLVFVGPESIHLSFSSGFKIDQKKKDQLVACTAIYINSSFALDFVCNNTPKYKLMGTRELGGGFWVDSRALSRSFVHICAYGQCDDEQVIVGGECNISR